MRREARAAGLAAIVAALLVLAACGGGSTPSISAACAAASASLPPVTAAADKAHADAAARSASASIAALNLALGGMSGPDLNPAALVNLRNATGYLADEYRNLAVLLSQPGSGLIGPLRTQGAAAYAQIDRSAAQLGMPACKAVALGRPLFAALIARTTAPAGPDLPRAGAAACQNIVAAYGTTQVAIDRRAADAQLERSAAALQAAARDVAAVQTPAGRHLRSGIVQAAGVLDGAVAAVARGADPAATTTAAFNRASALLAAGFRAAGLVCAVPGT
jgi:hypothetical protein